MGLRAGQLNKRVTVQVLTETKGAGGTLTESWDTHVSAWAAIEPLDGSEGYAAQQVEATTSHKVTIRYRSGVTTAMRVLYGSRVLAIQAVLDPKEKGEALVLLCREEDNEEGA